MIHVFNEPERQIDDWSIWSDTEVSEKDGRCVGTGKTKKEAIADAIRELSEDLETLYEIRREMETEGVA